MEYTFNITVNMNEWVNKMTDTDLDRIAWSVYEEIKKRKLNKSITQQLESLLDNINGGRK